LDRHRDGQGALLPAEFGLHGGLVHGEGQAGTATLLAHAMRIGRFDDPCAGVVEPELEDIGVRDVLGGREARQSGRRPQGSPPRYRACDRSTSDSPRRFGPGSGHKELENRFSELVLVEPSGSTEKGINFLRDRRAKPV